MFNPSRSKPALIVRSETPYNAEPPLDQLRSSFITAQPVFYVRSHGNIPHLDGTKHRLQVGGRVTTPLDLSMADLRARFPRCTVTAVMQCAGNRRGDMQQVRPVSGDLWAAGAIGNAIWSGVMLSDVLRAAGTAETAGLHVALAACDVCEVEGERFHYAASIPMAKAMSPEVLLAYEMNGATLPPEHGFPLRAVVPGFAGVRSPKWLVSVTVQDKPVDSAMQARDYKLFPPDVTKETADWDKGVTIYDMPLNAAICEPASHARLPAGPITLRGYAIGTVQDIKCVEVSIDGGRTWQPAEWEHNPAAPWSWTFWQATLNLPKGETELTVRAWDSTGRTQPEWPDSIWNFKGYLCTAWHRVKVTLY